MKKSLIICELIVVLILFVCSLIPLIPVAVSIPEAGGGITRMTGTYSIAHLVSAGGNAWVNGLFRILCGVSLASNVIRLAGSGERTAAWCGDVAAIAAAAMVPMLLVLSRSLHF